MLVIYGLLLLIGNGVAAGELLRPPVAAATWSRSPTRSTSAPRTRSRGRSPPLSGAARDSWLLVGRRPRVGAAWRGAAGADVAAAAALYEALRASVPWSFAVDPAVPPLAELDRGARPHVPVEEVMLPLWWLR